MGHDQFFKDFFRTFFRDFLELFYPDISAELDFGTVRFADKEVFTDFPDGSMRTADVVAELQTSDGVEKLVLVHIEVELNWGSDFGERMYEYYTLLQQRFRNEIIPIAGFLHGGGDGVVEETYKRASLGRRRLQFWYESVVMLSGTFGCGGVCWERQPCGGGSRGADESAEGTRAVDASGLDDSGGCGE